MKKENKEAKYLFKDIFGQRRVKKTLHVLERARTQNLLYQLKNYMAQQDLKQFSMTRRFEDGARAHVSSAAGIDTIEYTVPAPKVEEAEKRVSTLVHVKHVKSEHKIYYDIMGNPGAKFYIDLEDSGVPAISEKTGFGMAVLEYDAMYGVVFFMDNDGTTFIDYYRAEGMHIHCIMWHVNTRDGLSPITSGDYHKAIGVTFRQFEIPTPITSYSIDPTIHFWTPPPIPAPLLGLGINMQPRGVYCYMSGGTENRSLNNLVAELCSEICYLSTGSTTAQGIGVYNTESDAWRTIDFNGTYVPSDAYYNPHTFEAYVTTPGDNPKWSIVWGGPDYLDPTHYTVKGFLCVNEEYGSSIELVDFSHISTIPPGATWGVLGPGWPTSAARPGGFMAGSGSGTGRISFRVGKFHEPFGGPPPDYVCSISNKKEFVINGVYYSEETSLPTGIRLPDGLGRMGREMWEAKRFYKIPDKGGRLIIPTVDGGGGYIWGYPTSITSELIGRHPRFPGEEFSGGTIQVETSFLYDMDWGLTVCSSFGCIWEHLAPKPYGT